MDLTFSSLKRNIDIRFKTFFFLNFMGNGVFIPYLALYFSHQGITGVQLGVLLAVFPFVRILAQPVWSLLSDVYQLRRPVLSFSLLGLGLSALAFPLADSFAISLVVVILFAFLEAPYIPLGTTLALGYLGKNRREDQFGQLRLWGSVGYILSTLLVGAIFLDTLIDWVPAVFAAVMIVSGLLSISLPEASETRAVRWIEALRLLPSHPGLSLLLLGLVFVGATIGISMNYLAVYLDALRSPGWIIGLAVAVQAISEIPLMQKMPDVIRRTGLPLAYFAGIAILPIRWLLYAVIQEPVLILPVQILHGVTIVSVVVVGATYVGQLLPAEWSATAQGLLSTAFGGVGMSAGLVLAGYVEQMWGLHALWITNTVLGLIGALITIQALKKTEAQRRAQP